MMSVNRLSGIGLAGIFFAMVASGCGGAAKGGLGAPCVSDSKCASGVCGTFDGVRLCTEPCVVGGAACPLDASGGALTCRENAQCGPACNFSGLQLDYLCDTTTGTVMTCEQGNDVQHCGVCGCTPFGGGICLDGRGCVDPVANGGTCDIDALCTSQLCNPSTLKCTAPLGTGVACTADRYCASGLCNGTCVVPLPDASPCTANRYCQSGICDSQLGCLSPGDSGDDCRLDSHCVSGNCSNDGNTSVIGHCNIPLLSDCSGNTDPYCNRCVTAPLSFNRKCSRTTCTSATSCGSNWSCEPTTTGGFACFEHCTYNSSFQCQSGGGSCHSSGFCW